MLLESRGFTLRFSLLGNWPMYSITLSFKLNFMLDWSINEFSQTSSLLTYNSLEGLAGFIVFLRTHDQVEVEIVLTQEMLEQVDCLAMDLLAEYEALHFTNLLLVCFFKNWFDFKGRSAFVGVNRVQEQKSVFR